MKQKITTVIGPLVGLIIGGVSLAFGGAYSGGAVVFNFVVPVLVGGAVGFIVKTKK